MVNVMGAYGHFFPMVPLAKRLEAHGHNVVVVTREPYRDEVERFGFRVIGVDPSAEMRQEMRHERADEIRELQGRDRLRVTIAGFLAESRAHAHRLLEVADDERPDLLVRETTAWGSWLAGEVLDIPVAMFDFSPAPTGLFAHVLGDLFQEARAVFDLPPDPDLGSLDRWLTVLGAPPGWFPSECFRPTTHLVQPPEDPESTTSLPDWFASLPDLPIVYVTLGTVFQTAELFGVVVEALADLPISVAMTVGPKFDIESLGALPERVHVAPFIPQALVLAHVDAVVAHGGYGSLMGALRHGRPVVSIPLAAADNHLNAARVEQLGAGISVPEDARSVEAIRAAALEVLNNPTYRQRAQQIAEGINALPPFSTASELLERLAVERQPLEADHP
jgi:UDP:flavonoid glycosyltransferase YjiC (YdhE family)